MTRQEASVIKGGTLMKYPAIWWLGTSCL